MSLHESEIVQKMRRRFKKSDIIHLEEQLYGIVSMPVDTDTITVMPVERTDRKGVFSLTVDPHSELRYTDLTQATLIHRYFYNGK